MDEQGLQGLRRWLLNRLARDEVLLSPNRVTLTEAAVRHRFAIGREGAVAVLAAHADPSLDWFGQLPWQTLHKSQDGRALILRGAPLTLPDQQAPALSLVLPGFSVILKGVDRFAEVEIGRYMVHAGQATLLNGPRQRIQVQACCGEVA